MAQDAGHDAAAATKAKAGAAVAQDAGHEATAATKAEAAAHDAGLIWSRSSGKSRSRSSSTGCKT